MQINAPIDQSYYYDTKTKTNAELSPAKAEKNTGEKEGIAASTKATAAKGAHGVSQIAARYDVTDISPREIDQLAKELKESDQISDGDWLMLLTRGAEFLSHFPGNYYTDDKLNERSDLLGNIQRNLGEAEKRGDPTLALKRQLAFLENLQAQGNSSKTTGYQLGTAAVADETLSGLLSLQET